jgi:hypothetical protein
MSDFRCIKHDRVFESFTDSRKPGAEGHPAGGGHPDCPKCKDEAKNGVATSGRKIG